jgi:hypothetical protein
MDQPVTTQPVIYDAPAQEAANIQITDNKFAPSRGRPDGATWAPWAERLVPFSAEVNVSSESPLRFEKKCHTLDLANPLQTMTSQSKASNSHTPQIYGIPYTHTQILPLENKALDS